MVALSAGYVDLEARDNGAFSFLAGNPLAVAVALALLASGVCLTVSGDAGAYDGDLWWILATGRDIAAQGAVPHSNPFALDAGDGYVVQQWLHDLLAWELYDAFGMAGVDALVLALAVAVAASLCALAVGFGGYRGRCKAVPFLEASVAFCLASLYITARPQAWSMVAYAAVALLCLRFLATGRPVFLAGLPAVVALHSNLHASMMPYDLFVAAVVLAPALAARRREPGWAARLALPALVALASMLPASCLNPYGADAPLYLFMSFGVASYGDMIQEMVPVGPDSLWGAAFFAGCGVAGGVALAKRAHAPLDALDISAGVLFVASAAAYAMNIRSVWLFAVFLLVFVARMLSPLDLVPSQGSRAAGLLSSPAVVIAVLVAGLSAPALNVAGDIASAPSDVHGAAAAAKSVPEVVPEAECSLLAEVAAAYPGGGLPLWNGFNEGGMLEFCGLPVSLDQRPELWEPVYSGSDRHVYRDYVDARKGDAAAAQRSVGGYDVALLNSGDAGGGVGTLLGSDGSGWRSVSLGDASEGYSLFVRAGTPADSYLKGRGL